MKIHVVAENETGIVAAQTPPAQHSCVRECINDNYADNVDDDVVMPKVDDDDDADDDADDDDDDDAINASSAIAQILNRPGAPRLTIFRLAAITSSTGVSRLLLVQMCPCSRAMSAAVLPSGLRIITSAPISSSSAEQMV